MLNASGGSVMYFDIMTVDNVVITIKRADRFNLTCHIDTGNGLFYYFLAIAQLQPESCDRVFRVDISRWKEFTISTLYRGWQQEAIYIVNARRILTILQELSRWCFEEMVADIRF